MSIFFSFSFLRGGCGGGSSPTRGRQGEIHPRLLNAKSASTGVFCRSERGGYSSPPLDMEHVAREPRMTVFSPPWPYFDGEGFHVTPGENVYSAHRTSMTARCACIRKPPRNSNQSSPTISAPTNMKYQEMKFGKLRNERPSTTIRGGFPGNATWLTADSLARLCNALRRALIFASRPPTSSLPPDVISREVSRWRPVGCGSADDDWMYES